MKRKHILQLCIAVFCCMMWKTAAYSQVRIDLGKNSGKEQIRVLLGDSSYTAVLDETGVATINISETMPAGYATLYRSRGVNYFYIIPGEPQTLKRNPDATLEFSGAAKAINEYLNGTFVNTLAPPYTLKEDEFIAQWKKLPAKVSAYLDSVPLPEDFKRIERKRMYYVICNQLLYQPFYYSRISRLESYTPGEAYYQELEKMMKEDPEATGLWEYKQTYRDWIHTWAARDGGVPLEQLRRELDYVRFRIKDTRLADYLTHDCLTGHIRSVGVEGVEEFLPFYKEKVKTPARLTEFRQIYEQYSRLAKGRKAPAFSLTDIDGRKVNLSDLRGKYVYIDIWATWCVPCCRELPALQKLEEQFADAPIAFVSVSIDANAEAWKSKVRQDKLGGIQLRAGKADSFQQDYQVQAIPHFVLIDPEGNIVEAKMTRPSNPKTAEMLRELIGL